MDAPARPRDVAPMDEDDIPGQLGDLLRIGTVESVDLGSATAVFRGGDVLSPPLPWMEWAGSFRTWTPPSAGEQVILLCPEGDIAGGVILRGIYSNAFPAPANDATHQIHGAAGLVITLTDDGLQIVAPGDVEITGNVQITGDVNVTGTVTADTDVVADSISLKSHTHGGVQSGGSNTGAPQ